MWASISMRYTLFIFIEFSLIYIFLWIGSWYYKSLTDVCMPNVYDKVSPYFYLLYVILLKHVNFKRESVPTIEFRNHIALRCNRTLQGPGFLKDHADPSVVLWHLIERAPFRHPPIHCTILYRTGLTLKAGFSGCEVLWQIRKVIFKQM